MFKALRPRLVSSLKLFFLFFNSSLFMQLLDSFTSTMMTNGWTEEHLLVLGVLSMVLHHSTQGALVETAKFILLDSSLASLMRATVKGFFANGSASIEHEEESDTEHALVFLLLFIHFYLRRCFFFFW